MAKLCSFNHSCDCSKQYVGFGAQMYRTFYQNYCILKVTENRYRSKFWGYVRGHLQTVIWKVCSTERICVSAITLVLFCT